ncbi:tricarballylate utilization LysR family transcriptional regulator TcuR [Pigmentiphaga soli]|uniref:Tricarballylate utilization LysR family transcriptional regulator TcuR n=1 Tax=Pigmentiphaga soli TaxID=1007095 RepID=A0ABP8HJK3_9BURK
MELRQLRYFVKVVESGGMGRAAAELGTSTSTLSQQISSLESELSTRLLQRRATGVTPTESGLAFFRQAQLILRQVENASTLAQQARLSGSVSVGLAQTTGAMLSVPFMLAMRERYPAIRLHIIEGLSAQLLSLLTTRRIDLAMVFDEEAARRLSAVPVLREQLFLIGRADLPGMPGGTQIELQQIERLPLLVPSVTHTLHTLIFDAMRKIGATPHIAAEIDGLSILLKAVRAGVGASIQPGSAIAGLNDPGLAVLKINKPRIVRTSLLASLADDELSPAAVAARVVLSSVARSLVVNGAWQGATVVDP